MRKITTSFAAIGIALMLAGVSPAAHAPAQPASAASFLKRKEDLILLKDLSQYFDEGSISPSLLFKYFQSIKSIVGTELSLEEYESQVAMLQIELKRLLERTCSKDKKETIIQKLITNSNNLNETGLASFLRYQAKRINSNKYCIDTDNFFSFIKIATKIAQ